MAMVYTTANTSLVKNFEHEIKYDMVANMANTFCWENSLQVKFLGQSWTLGQNIAFRERQVEAFNFDFDCFAILSVMIPTVTSNNLVLGWNVETLDRPVHFFTMV